MRNLVVIAAFIGLTACSSGDPAKSDSNQTPPSAPVATSGGDAAASPAPGATPVETPTSVPAEAPAPAPSKSSAERTAAETLRDPGPRFREITIPEGTTLPVTLRTTVASDTSNVEDQVRATLRRAITIDRALALPAGTVLIGHVTDAARSAKVKGRARVAFRFTRADLPGEGGRLALRTATVSRVAPATKKRDAATIGGGAVGGAIIGGIVGGGDGAAKGAVIGGGAGTGVVLATRGQEVRLPAGTAISVKLAAPLTVRVAVK
jgi:type IV secretory pathway VirB10-like protein